MKYMDRKCKKCKKYRVPFQYAIRRIIVRSREVSKPRDMRLKYAIALKFDRPGVAEGPIKFQSDAIIQTSNLVVSIFNEILPRPHSINSSLPSAAYMRQ